MSVGRGTIYGVKYRSTNKGVCSAKYHVIWCPKYRRRVIHGRVELRLKQIIGEVVEEVGGGVIQLETMPDHVHLLMEVPPTVAMSALVQKLKGHSSPTSPGVPSPARAARFVVTVVVRIHRWRCSAGRVRRYVENQRLAG